MTTTIRSTIFEKKNEFKSEKQRKAITNVAEFMQEKLKRNEKSKIRKKERNMEKKFGAPAKQIKLI